jgi:hypothetical protein
MVCDAGPVSINFCIKVNTPFVLNKSRTAHFVKCGNYLSSRKNSKYKLVFLRATMNLRLQPAGVAMKDI